MYLVLNRVAKWTIFVLIGQGLKASAAHLYQNFFWMPPPPPRGERNSIPQSIRLYITRPSFTYFEIKAYLCWHVHFNT